MNCLYTFAGTLILSSEDMLLFFVIYDSIEASFDFEPLAISNL